jgi:hypothetical protein
MQVSSSYQANGLYSDTNRLDPTQEQKDRVRETAAGVAGNRSKQAQIDIYTQTAKSANEQYDNSYETQQEYVEDYTDFAQQNRRAEYYQTLVEEGTRPSGPDDTQNRPDTQPVAQELTQEQRDTGRQAIVEIAQERSTQAQIDAYRAGIDDSQAQSDYNDTQDAIANYNDFSKQARRTEYLNIYIENSAAFA